MAVLIFEPFTVRADDNLIARYAKIRFVFVRTPINHAQVVRCWHRTGELAKTRTFLFPLMLNCT